VLLKIVSKGTPLLSCPKCKYRKILKQKEMADQKTNIRYGKGSEIAIIDKNEEEALRPLPTVNTVCPTCGKTESETWAVAIGAETTQSPLTFFRCTTCGTTRREAG
jgi:DNA-directed RNA polymerase subunit M/transcription elongation factor TFIIS